MKKRIIAPACRTYVTQVEGVAMSERERNVFTHLSNGETIKMAASMENLSDRTVDHYCEKWRFYLDCQNTAHLLCELIRRGVI